MEDVNLQNLKLKRRPSFKWILNLVLLCCFIFIGYYYFVSAPLGSKDIVVHVASKQTLTSVSIDLEKKNIVRNADVFKALVLLFKSGKEISRGDYLFPQGSSAFKVAWMLARSDHNVDPIKITFREGIANTEMANILADKLSVFRKDLFLSDERGKQGYLFPDTYFFFNLTTTDEILDEMSSNFKRRISSLDSDIKKSGHTLDEIITMASIVEREADGKDDAPVIAGILWKRIEKGMMLQADAAPTTYKALGLPSEPIANPGIMSIKATIAPKDSPYLFYIHDKSGMVHYASTYDEHKKNIDKYLR